MLTPESYTQLINSYLPTPHSDLLNGIIFGTPIKTSPLFYRQLKIVGLLHLIVLSGSNITILATFINSLTGRLSKQMSILITLLTIFLFILFVSPQAPIVRAAIMYSFTSVAIVFGRRKNALFSLFISALLIGIFFPVWISSISFQLSVAATLGIILFGKPKVSDNWIMRELRISLAAQILTAPLIFISFKTVSFISPLANIAVAWTVPPLMILGFLTVIFGKIYHPLGVLPALISFGLLSYATSVIHLLSRIPFASVRF